MTTHILDEALRLAGLGYRVFPLRPGLKVPWQGSRGAHDATTDEATIRSWWACVPESNIGLATHNIVALDIDPAALADLAGEDFAELEALLGDLPRQRTPRGGFHWVGQGAPHWKSSTSKLWRGIDLKAGAGSYIVVAPSCVEDHAKGVRGVYEWIAPVACEPGELPAIPPRVAEWIDAAHERAPQSAGPLPNGAAPAVPLRATPATLARARAYVAKGCPPAVQGEGGHAALLWAARVLVRGFLLPDDDAMRILADDFNPRCEPPWEGDELVRDFARKLREARTKPFDKPDGWLLDPEARGEAPIFAGGAPEARPGAVLLRMADVQPREVEWLWPGRVPLGKLSLIVGDGGCGKSTLTTDIAARVSSGAPWPDGGARRAPAGVVLLSAEDDPADTIRPRLDAHGADCARITLLQGVRDADGSERCVSLSDLPALEAAIDETPDCALVVVDPVSAFVVKGADSHNNSDVRTMLAPLSEMAARRRVALVVVSHLNKAGPGNLKALYRIMGSAAWGAAVRAAWGVTIDPDDPAALEADKRRLVVPLKMNCGKPAEPWAYAIVEGNGVGAVEWVGRASGVDVDRAMGGEKVAQRDAPARAEAEALLLDLLTAAPEGVPRNEIKDAAQGHGIAWRSVERAKGALRVDSRKIGFDGQTCWVWSLPGATIGAKGEGV